MARYGTEHEATILKAFAKNAKYGIVEIGVLDGETSKILIEASTVGVYGIDPIILDSMNVGLIGHLDQIKRNCNNERYCFIQDYSYNVAVWFDRKIDMIFIDGDHNYDAVKKDAFDWCKKIELGGVILFHDSAPIETFSGYDGVKKLVQELKDNKLYSYIGTWDTITGFKRI